MRMKKNYPIPFRRLITVLAVFLLVAIGVSPVMGMTVIPTNRNVNLSVVNDAGARFDDYGNEAYNFFNMDQSATQGQNALHVSSDNASKTTTDVTYTTAQSGVFYMTDTGGRGWDDDGILMLAVNGTVPDNFRVHIRSSGYRWTPVPTGSYPSYSGITYVPGAVDEYFTKADLIYGPQIWRPAPGDSNYYPIFDYQDMTNTSNTFSIMFIDLNTGILGPGATGQSDFSGQPVTDNGAIKIEYSFENLQTMGAFDAYAYTVSSNQGQGIRWLNRLSAYGGSGWFVTGQSPTVLTIPGQTNPPTDPDHDGLYEDLNGNGRKDFNDVFVFFKQMTWISNNEPVTLFDFNKNTRIDFNDVFLLFKEI
jgi:PKD repeat protein